MLHILLFILKVIGIVLLSIMGVFVLLILIILLLPIRYVAKGEFYHEGKVKLKVSWLLSLFTFFLIYEEGKVKSYIKILGFTLKETKKKEVVPIIKEDINEAADVSNEALKDISRVDLEELEDLTKTKKKNNKTKKKNKTKSKKMSWLEKLKFTFYKLCDRIKSIRDNKNKFIEFISKEENRKLFKLIKKQIFILLKHIKPTRLRGNLEFGFEDPSLTGYLLGFLSIFYPVYYKQITIKGNFETVIIKGDFFLKGRIRVVSLLAIAMRLIIDKNFRRMLKMIKK
ncbi:MAG: DUF2953 domain-containing protein [Clostridiales bacterium]|mgnify:CR=1 FL=1|nr:DUF2953 domain-containing protein [Clostridiales bacterium]